MAARVGFCTLSAFSKISSWRIPIARRIVCRNLHSLSKSPTAVYSKTTNTFPSGIIGKFPGSALIPRSHGLLPRRIEMPVLQRRTLSMFGGIVHHGKVVTNSGHAVRPKCGNMEDFTVLARNITIMSKRGKRKTCKAVAKRVHRTGKGKLKRWRAGKNHGMIRKSNKRRKQLKKPTYCNKQQLKLLNKMLNGW